MLASKSPPTSITEHLSPESLLTRVVYPIHVLLGPFLPSKLGTVPIFLPKVSLTSPSSSIMKSQSITNSSKESIVNETSELSLDIIESEEEIFSVQEVPNRGNGLVAVRAIGRGEVVLTESPLFSLTPSPSNSSVLSALSQCPRDEQRQFFALSNEYKGHLLPALGIFESNALYYHTIDKTEQGDGVQELAGLFILASRFNSSCTPNVSRCWDPSQQLMIFRTLQNVQEGEELCFNYCDVLGTKEQRREDVMQERNFLCRCEACELEGEESTESDRRRSTIARLFEEVGGCGKEPTLGMRKIKIALRLLNEERLVHYETSFHYDAFQFCILVSDFENAKSWIRRAWEVSCWTSGPDSDAARMFKMFWANPRAHELAGTLPDAVLCGPEPY